MTTRMDSLIKDDYKIQRFSDLPTPYQMAIIWFMAVDGQAWDDVDLSVVPCDDIKNVIVELLPKYIELYGEKLFGTVILHSSVIQNAIMCDTEISESFSNWEDYHSDYLRGGDIPKHYKTGRWPVILSNDDSETLCDGWHRFHSYMRDGAVEVDTIFFPEYHHIIAKGVDR